MNDEEVNIYDLSILGSGVAGLTCAMYALRAGLKTLIIDKAAQGGKALTITNLENYPGLYPETTGDAFINNLKMQVKEAARGNLSTVSAKVTSIDKKENLFYSNTKQGSFASLALVYAAGDSPRKLGIPGEDEYFGRGISTCALCDGNFFHEDDIAVIGGGESAINSVLYLSHIAKNITLIHRRDTFRADALTVDRLITTPNVFIEKNSIVTSIEGDGKKVTSLTMKNLVTQKETLMRVKGVFIYAGSTPNTALLDYADKDEAGYLISDDRMRVLVHGKPLIPGLFCAGDIRSKNARQVVTAAADGAISAISAYDYIKSLQ